MHFAVSLQKKFPEELECVTKALVKFPQGAGPSTGINQHLPADTDGFTSLCAGLRHMLPFVAPWVHKGADLHGQVL